MSIIGKLFGNGTRVTTKGTSKTYGGKHFGIRRGGDTNKSPGVGYITANHKAPGGREYYRGPRTK